MNVKQPHMFQEIMQQPACIEALLRAGVGELPLDMRKLQRIVIVGCGSSYYAGIAGKYTIEELAGVPVTVEVASEFASRITATANGTLAICISQSGETGDTLACAELWATHNVPTLAIVNVPESRIAKACDHVLLVQAGREQSVAATKSFTNQVVALQLLAVRMAEQLGKEPSQAQFVSAALQRLPHDIQNALGQADEIERIAHRVTHFTNALYVGRGPLSAIALEGALKIKEVSYLHAQALPGGELKHGPLAMVDKTMLGVCLVAQGALADKARGDAVLLRTAGATVVVITDDIKPGDHAIRIATSSPWTSPLVLHIAQQLLAYYVAMSLGRDVDNPRHLTKSVTVE